MKASSESDPGLPPALEAPTLPPRRLAKVPLPSRASMTPAGVARTVRPNVGRGGRARRFGWVLAIGGGAAMMALCCAWLVVSVLQLQAVGSMTDLADEAWAGSAFAAADRVRSLQSLGVPAPAEHEQWVETLRSGEPAERRQVAADVRDALDKAIAAVGTVPAEDQERLERAEDQLARLQLAEAEARALHEELYRLRGSVGGRVVRLVGVVD